MGILYLVPEQAYIKQFKWIIVYPLLRTLKIIHTGFIAELIKTDYRNRNTTCFQNTVVQGPAFVFFYSSYLI